MKIFAAILTSVGLLLAGAAATAQPTKPTIVLVHGAFADSSSWYGGVIAILERDGYRVVAAADPLRSVKGDADTAIPPKLHAFMAERAHPRATSVVAGASHVVMISHADAVAKVIEDAANAR